MGTTTTTTATSAFTGPKDHPKSGLPPPTSTRSRNLIAPIAFRPTFDEASSPLSEDDLKGGSVRLRPKVGDLGSGFDGSEGDQPSLGRPKSTLGLGSTSQRVGSSIRVASGIPKGEETKVERRRSMLWDRSAPGLSGPSAGPGLRHKRSVSAIPGLSAPFTSMTRPVDRDTSRNESDIKGEEGLGERKTGTGMLLRPRPNSVVLSKRAGQAVPAPKPSHSVRPGKPEPNGSARLASALSTDPATADKRISKRRSMMYLGQGPGAVLQAPIELERSKEVLLDETGTSGEEVDVHVKRQEALNRLMGKDDTKVDEAKKVGTPVPTPVRSVSAGTGATKLDTPIRRARATASTTEMHERAGSTPVVPRSMRANTSTGLQRNRISIGTKPTTGLTSMPKPTVPNRARMGMGRRAGDSSAMPEVGDGLQGRTSVINRSTTPVPTGTPKRLQPPSTGTTPNKTPSRRDPLNRLRGTPGGSSDTRTRKQSNDSDIDSRMEQSSRKWLVELGGEDKESPLMGKVGELRVTGGSGRIKRMSSQGSGMGFGGDVFGKPLVIDQASNIKIKELEAQLQAIRLQHEQKRAERLEVTRKERQRRQVIDAMSEVVRACEEELRILQRDRDERGKQVDLFEKAWEMAVSSV